MAFSHDFSTSEDGFTFTSSGQTFNDWEGLSRTVVSNVPAIQGGRIAQNMLPDTENENLWDATGLTPPTLGGPTTYLGESVLQTITFDTSMTSVGYGGCRAQTDNAFGRYTATIGRDYVLSIKVCLSRNLELGEDIRIFSAGTPDSPAIVIDEDPIDADEWISLSTAPWTASATNSNCRVILYLVESINFGSVTVYVKEVMVEDVTGQSDQNPSNFTESTSYFSYENANTVTNNVVTHAQGAELTTIDGILLETGGSMTKAVTVPANNFTVTIVFTPNFDNTFDKTTDRPLLELSDGTANNVFSIDFDQTNDQFHLTKTVAAASAGAETFAGDILYSSGDEITLSIASTEYGAHIKANSLPWVTVSGTTAELDWSTLLNQIELFPPDVAIKSVTLTSTSGGGSGGGGIVTSIISQIV